VNRKGKQMRNLQDRVIVVTGAAGNLGSAVCKAFLHQGCTVCGLDHKEGRLDGMVDFVSGNGMLYIFDNVDVTDREGMLRIGEKIREEVGSVDVIVNTVGGFTMGERVDQISAETWQSMMSLNVQSFLNCSAAFVPEMIENESGKVITVGSRASLKGGARMGAYAAAKGALLRLTESLADELGQYQIQVNCVMPSTIDTPENREEMPKADFSKWVAPEKIADVIVFLASEESDAVNGVAIPVFGSA